MDLSLKTVDSPLLKRLGLQGDEDGAGNIKAGDWVRARVKGNLDKAVAGGHMEKSVLGGVKSVSVRFEALSAVYFLLSVRSSDLGLALVLVLVLASRSVHSPV
ncbi:hypothetical protein LTR33_014569 [Friedmanniomyces endolithicus]|nr:hypothetical protein LTR33_014569 [Friedmanniomyces endolithicus]